MNPATIEQTSVVLPFLLTPLNIAITLVFAVLGIVALVYVHKAVAYLETLTGVKLSEQQKQDIDDAVITGIHNADEQAHKFARGLIPEGPTTPEQKLAVAESAARSIAPAALASVTSTQFQVRAEAALASIRPPAPIPDESTELADSGEPITQPETPRAKR
jgi:hypothetical protein